MKRSNVILLLATLTLVTFVSTALSQAPKAWTARKHRALQKTTKGLNLTADQKAKMADLRLAHQKAMLPLQTELQGKLAELRLLKTEANPDLNKIDRLIEESEKIRTRIQKAKVRHQLEVRKILTPEQQKIWDSRTLQAPGHRRMMMGRKFRGAQTRL